MEEEADIYHRKYESLKELQDNGFKPLVHDGPHIGVIGPDKNRYMLLRGRGQLLRTDINWKPIPEEERRFFINQVEAHTGRLIKGNQEEYKRIVREQEKK
jgi:hypothetical protein